MIQSMIHLKERVDKKIVKMMKRKNEVIVKKKFTSLMIPMNSLCSNLF